MEASTAGQCSLPKPKAAQFFVRACPLRARQCSLINHKGSGRGFGRLRAFRTADGSTGKYPGWFDRLPIEPVARGGMSGARRGWSTSETPRKDGRSRRQSMLKIRPSGSAHVGDDLAYYQCKAPLVLSHAPISNAPASRENDRTTAGVDTGLPLSDFSLASPRYATIIGRLLGLLPYRFHYMVRTPASASRHRKG